MNSMIVEINEECAEVRIITGITAYGVVVERVYGQLCGVMAGTMAGARYRVTMDEPDIIDIEEGSPLVVIVYADADDRVVVSMYNTTDTPANAVLSLMAELTEFKA